jgi:hypothetical protein
MPAALNNIAQFDFKKRLQALPPQSVLVFSGALLFGIGLWGLVGPSAEAGTKIVPFYPTMQSTVEMVDLSRYTVAEIIDGLPMTSRFSMLLYNGHVDISNEEPVTVFVPADNYFDYLPQRGLTRLNYYQVTELAAHHIVPRVALGVDEARSGSYLTLLGDTVSFEPRGSDQSASVDGGFIVKGYRAKNGIVYLTSKVLVPEDIKTAMLPPSPSLAAQ